MQTELITKKRPSHIIWQVIGDKDNAFWHRVGAAWPHRDGKGLFLKFDAHPVVGRTVIREVTDKATKNGDGR